MKFIVFYGMMKSGNHAIIRWVFENICKSMGIDAKYEINCCHERICFYNDITRNPPKCMFFREMTLLSIEDEYVPIKEIIGDQTDIQEVFIFRDVYNTIASRLRCKEYSVQYFGDIPRMCHLYRKMKQFARRGVSIQYEDVEKSNVLKVLGVPLSVKFSDIPPNFSKVHQAGWSSFGTTEYHSRKNHLTEDERSEIEKALAT